MKKILDVSEHQPVINYAEVAKQVDGVILRCGVTGWGTANECRADECFEQHYAGFKAVGLPVGAYYYSAADTIAKAEEEAEFCQQLLAGKTFALPIYIDIENPQRMEPLSADKLTAQVERWCRAMEAAGFFVGVYANTDYFTRKLHHAQLADKYTIWLADYRAQPNTSLRRDLHQYTSTAQVAGISGGVDMSNLVRADLMEAVTGSGRNGCGDYQPQPDPPADHNLYTVVFGPATAGDRDAAVALGNGLQLEPRSEEIGAAANGRALYRVSFKPMTGGDMAAISMLGDRLGVTVEVSGGQSTRQYIVRTGDSWYLIAAQQLGSESKVGELLAANGADLGTTIHPGDVLVLPE